MDLNIHCIKKVSVSALSLTRSDNGTRFHIQRLIVTDESGKEVSISLFFDKASQVLPVGDCSKLDQADSNEDYLGFIEGESVAF